jgi:RNA recognition motif-containing protein
LSAIAFVGNRPLTTGDHRLRDVFEAIDPVDPVNIVRDQMTGRARGFAFRRHAAEDGAESATQRLNDTELDGRRLAVNEARPKRTDGGRGGRSWGRQRIAAPRAPLVTQGGGMRNSRPTQHKRARERARQEKQQEKAARRAEMKHRKAARAPTGADQGDPDIAGIVPGPQRSPWDDH